MDFKPRPINKREFLAALPEPYQLPEREIQPYPNPNEVYSSEVRPGQPEFNRALETSLKGDDTKTITIGLEDHDNTIMYYLENVIKPTVIQNNRQIAVPIIYGSPERWKSIQADGFYRDVNGKIMTPLIMLKRESFEKNRNIGNKLDGNSVHNVQYFEKGYSSKNNYDNFNVLRNQKPQKEYILGIIPDYITITYKLSVYTDYTEQMNKIIEALEFASDSYWGDPERFLFRAAITSFPTPTLLENGADRASKSDLSLIVQGYIIPDTINVAKAGPSPKSYNVTKTSFTEKVV
jgi:hypothetical protein